MTKTALITGASSGLGLDFTRLFAADGYDLVLVTRTESRLREIAASLDVKTTVVPVDLSKPGAAREIVNALGGVPIDALVNNAGYGVAGPFVRTDLQTELDMDPDQRRRAHAPHEAALPQMVARRSGRVLNVASTASFQLGAAHGRLLRDEGVRAVVLRGDRGGAAGQGGSP